MVDDISPDYFSNVDDFGRPKAPQSQPLPNGPAHGSIPGFIGIDGPGLWSGAKGMLTGRSGFGAVRAGRALYDDLSRSSFDDVQVGNVERKEPPRDAMFGGPPAPPPSTSTEPTFASSGPLAGQTAQSDAAPGQPLDIKPELAGIYNSAQTPQQDIGLRSPYDGFFQKGSLLDKVFSGLGSFRDQNRLTLLAMAGGLAGSQSWGQGLGRAFTAAVPAQMADIQQNRQNQTIDALTRKGYSLADARAAVANPAIMNQIVPMAFGAKQWQITDIGHDPLTGQAIKGWVNPVTLEARTLTGQPLGGPNAVQGAAGVGGSSFLAPGVQTYNPNLVGEDYLKQFGPEVQGAVQAYMRGGVMPTGNPRNQGIATLAKTIAQKYANDMGQPDLADDTNYPARRQMRSDLSKDTPGSIGGQLTFGGTSLGHLGDVAEKTANLNNANGFGITPLARWANTLRGQTTDQAAKVNDAQSAVQHYGQEITKFYTGSPGGEAERMRFLNTMDTAKSPKEIAGAIRAERDLIPDRLRQIGKQIADRLGPEEAQKQMGRVDVDGAVAKINKALARLDPDGPEAKMLGSLPRPQTTADAMKLPKGTHFFDPEGIERVR
jgi:hypothetical protein